MEKQLYTPDIFVLRNFLSPEECIALIEQSEALGYEEAMVDVGNGVQRMVKGVRNNERVLHKDQAYATFIWERLKGGRHEGALLAAGVKYVLRTDIMYKQINTWQPTS
ncbi:hypothetical protein [Chitinophaga sp. 212800010-3]|uniref:hypothetical protein n=1 Tax=unclassified Chitinophaga TaxID=2619133 RepID=UPI002DF2E656|nr:hypothetical protein [Chitinophaga sp. 212800010-3]